MVQKLLQYVKEADPFLPIEHWIIIGAISLILPLLFWPRIKCSFYGFITLVFTSIIGLYLLDALAINRICNYKYGFSGLDLGAEIQRWVHGPEKNRISMLFNVISFIPFGYFLSESIFETTIINNKHCLRIVILVSFGISFCIEFFQFVFHVGYFELTDLILNTIGALIGSIIALSGRKVWAIMRQIK